MHDLLCQVVTLNVIRPLLTQFNDNLALHDPRGVCEGLTFSSLEYIANEGGGRYSLRFYTMEGDPPRLFAATSVLASRHTLTIESLYYGQVTRYKKYEACAPVGVPQISVFAAGVMMAGCARLTEMELCRMRMNLRRSKL